MAGTCVQYVNIHRSGMHAAAERRRAGKICHAATPRALTPMWKFEIENFGKNKVFKFWQYATYLRVKKIGTYEERFLIS